MPAAVVVGAQWGDEGKGKIVDLLTPHADLVVRFAGGANAGHTLVVGGEKLVLHLVPSGILHEGKRCVIGQGTVVDPGTLLGELDALRGRGVDFDGRLFVADRAHVVLPHHKEIDGLREAASDERIGTTKRGIGPAYEDKVGRRGIRVGDLGRGDLAEKLGHNLAGWSSEIAALGGTVPTVEDLLPQLQQWGKQLAPYVEDGARIAAEALEGGQNVLLEGAQGTMLDVDHGTYPFVTSSNATSGGACTGSGVGPTAVKAVIGIAKAYATRVGGGPFPTEIHGEAGDALRKAGAEFGATTGRPRRCGWIDIPALRMARRVNGLTSLAITKLDVLTGLPEIQVCVGYRDESGEHREPPFDAMSSVEPVYETLAGWTEDVRDCRSKAALPDAARAYLDRVEALVGCPVTLVSVGPDREETFGAANLFETA
ncbi:MAG: adenylosuccinate synthase [Myxococcota bacterium]